MTVTLLDYETIEVTVDKTVATITLNRPDQLNAWDWQMHRELRTAYAALDASDDTYVAKVRVLEDDVDRHVEEEEDELFATVRKLLSEDELVDLAEAMQATEEELKGGGSPREAVLAETSKAAEI